MRDSVTHGSACHHLHRRRGQARHVPRRSQKLGRVRAGRWGQTVEHELASIWFGWEWLPGDTPVLAMAIFTDGSALLAAGAVASGGWGLLVLAAVVDCSGRAHFGLIGCGCGPLSPPTVPPPSSGAPAASLRPRRRSRRCSRRLSGFADSAQGARTLGCSARCRPWTSTSTASSRWTPCR